MTNEKTIRLAPMAEKRILQREVTDEELRDLDKAELERYRLKIARSPIRWTRRPSSGCWRYRGDYRARLSEASREAVLAQLLVAFGNMIGPGCT